jgi:mRNA-degrading endonuclease toxin of MazEF toxin-antitoxin module
LPARRPDLRRGRIIWVTLADSRGNLKRRPALILTATADIRADEPFEVMAISTSFPDPPPANHVELPWHNDPRRAVTRLRTRSAAVINWLRSVHPNDVADHAGDVPPALMLEILRRLDELDQDDV